MIETLTEELIEQIAALVEDGAWPVTAAGVCRVGRPHFERWYELGIKLYDVEEPPDLDDLPEHEQLCYLLVHRIHQAEAVCEGRWLAHWHRSNLTERRSNSHVGWMALLERRFPERWGRRSPATTPEPAAAYVFEDELRRLDIGR